MSHHHGSGSCNSDCQHHDHDSGTGPADNLYSFIDLPNTIALNVADETSGTKVIKPWHERQDETVVNTLINHALGLLYMRTLVD